MEAKDVTSEKDLRDYLTENEGTITLRLKRGGVYKELTLAELEDDLKLDRIERYAQRYKTEGFIP